MKKLILLLIVLVAGGFAFYSMQNNSPSEDETIEESEGILNESPAQFDTVPAESVVAPGNAEPRVVETVVLETEQQPASPDIDWKTYTDSALGFSFKYAGEFPYEPAAAPDNALKVLEFRPASTDGLYVEVQVFDYDDFVSDELNFFAEMLANVSAGADPESAVFEGGFAGEKVYPSVIFIANSHIDEFRNGAPMVYVGFYTRDLQLNGIMELIKIGDRVYSTILRSESVSGNHDTNAMNDYFDEVRLSLTSTGN